MNLLPALLRRPAPAVAVATASFESLEAHGFHRAADFRADVSALPTELTRLFEEYKHLDRTPVLPSAAEVLAARRAVALAEAEAHHLTERRDRRLTNLTTRRADAQQHVTAQLDRRRATQAAPLPDTQPDPLLLYLKSAGVVLLGLFLAVFYLNSVYLGFFPSLPMAGGGTAAEQARAYLSAAALFRPELAGEALRAVLPALAAGALLTLALVLHAPTVRQRRGLGAGLVVGTLLLDMLLAYQVHASAVAARFAMSLPAEAVWYLNPQFYLILGFGFGMAMLFSVALDSLFHLRALRNPLFRRQQLLAETEVAVEAAEAALADLRTQAEREHETTATALWELRRQITDHEVRLLQPRYLLTYDGRLRVVLESFQAGWLRYTQQAGHELAPHTAAYDAFRARIFSADGVAEARAL